MITLRLAVRETGALGPLFDSENPARTRQSWTRRGRARAGVSEMSREMTGAEMVIEALADQGVRDLFGYPGGAVLPIYDALFQQNKVRHILVRHEQGAVHAAEGYARSTGKV